MNPLYEMKMKEKYSWWKNNSMWTKSFFHCAGYARILGLQVSLEDFLLYLSLWNPPSPPKMAEEKASLLYNFTVCFTSLPNPYSFLFLLKWSAAQLRAHLEASIPLGSNQFIIPKCLYLISRNSSQFLLVVSHMHPLSILPGILGPNTGFKKKRGVGMGLEGRQKQNNTYGLKNQKKKTTITRYKLNLNGLRP